MASLLSPRRTIAELSLRATDARPAATRHAGPIRAGPPLGWPVAAVAGGLVSALAGWMLCAGLAVVGWLAADPGTLGDALGVGTRLWLLSNGVGVSLGGMAVTLVPWGATAVVAFMLSWFAAFAARRVRARAAGRAGHRGRVLLATYLVPVLVGRGLAGPALARPAALGGRHRACSAWPRPSGASRALGGGSPTAGRTGRGPCRGPCSAPSWCCWSPGPRCAADRADPPSGPGRRALHAGAGPRGRRGHRAAAGPAGPGPERAGLGGRVRARPGFVLGSRLGRRTRRHRARHAARPAAARRAARRRSGATGRSSGGWRAGVLAGAVAAWLVVRSRPAMRFDASSLVGGLAGVLAGVVFVGLAWAAGGDLGIVRLAGLGPRLLPLLVMAADHHGPGRHDHRPGRGTGPQAQRTPLG